MALGGNRVAKPAPKEEMREEPGAPEPGQASASQSYMVSVWSGSDGKFGAGVKIFLEPTNGETLEQAAKRANAFAVLKLREVETALQKQ